MSNDKIDQLKQFAAKDLEQTKADFQQAKDKVSELGSDIKQKGQETVEDVKNFAAKDIDQTKADLQQAKDKANELKQKASKL
jgi:hypothetical protein